MEKLQVMSWREGRRQREDRSFLKEWLVDWVVGCGLIELYGIFVSSENLTSSSSVQWISQQICLTHGCFFQGIDMIGNPFKIVFLGSDT